MTEFTAIAILKTELVKVRQYKADAVKIMSQQLERIKEFELREQDYLAALEKIVK